MLSAVNSPKIYWLNVKSDEFATRHLARSSLKSVFYGIEIGFTGIIDFFSNFDLRELLSYHLRSWKNIHNDSNWLKLQQLVLQLIIRTWNSIYFEQKKMGLFHTQLTAFNSTFCHDQHILIDTYMTIVNGRAISLNFATKWKL